MFGDFIAQNQAFIIGVVSTLAVWILSKLGLKSIDKAQVVALLTLILDIIQDIKTNPQTAGLDDFAKKQLALKRVEATVPKAKQSLLKKIFGSVGGAIEYVFHNKKDLSKLPNAAKVAI